MNAKSRPGIFIRAAFAAQWTAAHICDRMDGTYKRDRANAVVAANVHARHLYERLGFRQIGTIPQGFRMKDGHYEDICPYYHEL